MNVGSGCLGHVLLPQVDRIRGIRSGPLDVLVGSESPDEICDIIR